MITGAHSVICSKKPDADRAFFRDVLKLPHVDVGDGWLIFGLPPAEVAVHPSSKNNVHELYLMCRDIDTLIAALRQRGIKCGGAQSGTPPSNLEDLAHAHLKPGDDIGPVQHLLFTQPARPEQ